MKNTQEKNKYGVFAPNDFKILRDALAVYIRMAQHGSTSEEELSKMYSLYHRLGRVTSSDDRT